MFRLSACKDTTTRIRVGNIDEERDWSATTSSLRELKDEVVAKHAVVDVENVVHDDHTVWELESPMPAVLHSIPVRETVRQVELQGAEGIGHSSSGRGASLMMVLHTAHPEVVVFAFSVGYLSVVQKERAVHRRLF